MGVIKYGVCLKKNPVKGTTKAYAVINSEEFNFTDMAEQVTAETTVTRTDCVAVMRAVVDIAKREILKGNRIVLGDLGTIYPTLTSKGQAKVEDLTAHYITHVNLRFRPSPEFSNEVQKATFEKTALKKTMRKALADEQAAMAAKLAALGDQGGDDGDGDGTGDDTNP